jgi:hypothetical protein
MDEKALDKIADRLEKSGHDAGHLHELQVELDMLERPPGLWSRISGSFRQFAARQKSFLAGEFTESREAVRIARKAVTDRESITEEERRQAREQMFDLFRMLPAGAVVFANAALPIPGASVLTPKILQKLGLLPSRWREAHLLDHLQTEVNRLRSEGLESEASEIAAICEELEQEAEDRAQVAREARLLTFWDLDGNGQWDPEEREAYAQALDSVNRHMANGSGVRCWYLLEDGEVYGPVRGSDFPAATEAENILVCQAEDRLWVSLAEVLEAQ